MNAAHAVRMGVACALNCFHDPGVIVGDLVYPILVHVALPRPAILEARARRKAIWRGVEIPALVERRVSGDQVHGFAVHGTKKKKIVAVEERAVCPVRFPHARA